MTENITVFTHSSIKIEDRGRVVYIDPFQMGDEPHDADFIMITHDHYDHFSQEDIRKVVGAGTVLIIPDKMNTEISDIADLFRKVITVKPGVYKEVDGLELQTVPAYNLFKPFHPKSAGWVGYLLRIDGKRIYIAGDTDATKEAKAVKADIVLVPVGGTYTMDTKKAAELVNMIRPEVAIPVHYGNVVGNPGDGELFAQMVNPPTRVELKIKPPAC